VELTTRSRKKKHLRKQKLHGHHQRVRKGSQKRKVVFVVEKQNLTQLQRDVGMLERKKIVARKVVFK
jgi:hypothetical protein